MKVFIESKLAVCGRFLRLLTNALLETFVQLKAKIFRKRNLEEELQACQVAATEGILLAEGNYNEIKNTLIDAAQSLSAVARSRSKIDSEHVETQKNELRRLTDSVAPIGDDLQKLRGRAIACVPNIQFQVPPAAT